MRPAKSSFGWGNRSVHSPLKHKSRLGTGRKKEKHFHLYHTGSCSCNNRARGCLISLCLVEIVSFSFLCFLFSALIMLGSFVVLDGRTTPFMHHVILRVAMEEKVCLQSLFCIKKRLGFLRVRTYHSALALCLAGLFLELQVSNCRQLSSDDSLTGANDSRPLDSFSISAPN